MMPLDLTRFPLLRPDEVPLHSVSTLSAAEKELYDTSRDASLLGLIQRELANRRVNALLFGDDDGDDERGGQEVAKVVPEKSALIPTAMTKAAAQIDNSGGPPSRAPLGHGQQPKTLLSSPTPQPLAHFTSFVTTQSNNAKGFKDRAREAARSRRAKAMEQSEEHKLRVAEKQREERRRAIVLRMEERRQRLRQAKEAREMKRQREQQRRAERARELEEEMELAAEAAKAEAESSGMTHQEAIASAAAAAAALVECASSCDIGDFDSDCDVTIASSDGSSTCEPPVSEPATPSGAAASGEGAGNISVGCSIGEEAAGGDLDSPGRSGSESGSSGRLGASDLSKSESSNVLDSDSSVHVDEANIGGEEPQADLQESPQISSSPSFSSSNDVGGRPDEVASEFSSILVVNDEEDTLASHAETLDQYHPETPRSPTAMSSPILLPPSAQERTFVSIYPHFWSLFTAFSQNKSASPLTPVANRDRKNKARPTEAIDALLKHQIRINKEFLGVIEDYIELHDASTVGSKDPSACLSSDRFVLINSGRPDVASLISDVLTAGYDCDKGGLGRWHEMPDDVELGNCFNLLWTWRQPQVDVQSLLLCQKINRFRGTRCLTRKDLLKKSIQKSSASTGPSASHADLRGIMPLTFVLPQEYNAFVAAFSAIQRIPGVSQSNLWISKPIGMSRGRGISVVNDIGDISYSQPIVVQKYLMNPLLFRGYKFDLRLYVLVTAFSGLEAFIHSEGLARFASKPFSARPDSIYDEQIHLTNSSIQKEYQVGSDHPVRMAGAAGGDNKVRLTWLFRRLEGQGGIDTKLLWDQIKELCRNTLQIVDGNVPTQPNSFEIFGFDVIITDELKPMLIEVNACPALARDSALDADVKEALIRDTIALVDPPTIDRMALSRICNERLGGQSGGNLEEDLCAIFMGRLPRQIGEIPRDLGGYEILVVPESIK